MSNELKSFLYFPFLVIKTHFLLLIQFTQALEKLFSNLYSDSYVLATSAYNTQYIINFYHYYLLLLFIFNVAIYNFQFKNLYFFFVVFVQYKNLYFFVVLPLTDLSEILICLYGLWNFWIFKFTFFSIFLLVLV